jgi:hypothetical protein
MMLVTNSETEPPSRCETRPAGLTGNPSVGVARCYLRLANLPSYALYRPSRYETALWRQVAQILFALDALDRREPQERTGRFRSHGSYEATSERNNDT